MKKLSRVVLMATAATLVIGLAVTSVSEAQQGRRGRRAPAPNDAGMVQRGLDRLDLSDDQRETIKEMRVAHRQQAVLRRGEMASLRAQLQAELMNDDLNESKVRSLSKQISDLRSEADAARLDHRLAMRKVLTPEQREKLQEMRMNGPRFGKRGGPGMHQGRGGRGGPGLHGGHHGRGFRGGPGMHRGGGFFCDPEAPPAPETPPAPEGDESY